MTEAGRGSDRLAEIGGAAADAPLPVLILAAYPSVRAGLMALLATDPGLAPSATAWSAVDWGTPTTAWSVPSPAAIVVSLDGASDIAIDELRDQFSDVPLVFLGGDLAVDGPGLRAGPVAYLAPDADGPSLIAAVRGVAAGLTILDPTALGSSLQTPGFGGFPATAAMPPGEPLTARERQVLELVAEGLPNKAIARALGISEHTAKFHVGSLLGKLGAGSRTEAVMIATRRGLLAI